VPGISETLREQQSRYKIAEEENTDGESSGVLDAHSRSIPLTINALSAKNATVRITSTRSSMGELQLSGAISNTEESSPADWAEEAS
jgi:hypothetical protein